MRTLRDNLVLLFPRKHSPAPHSAASRGHMVFAVSQLVSSLWGSQADDIDIEYILQSLNLPAPHRELLRKGINSYSLPGQVDPQQGDICEHLSKPAFEKYVSPAILKVCHISPIHIVHLVQVS